MNIETAIQKAGNRRKLAELLGVAYMTTYRWKPDVPDPHVYKLRVLRPQWFTKDGKPRAETKKSK